MVLENFENLIDFGVTPINENEISLYLYVFLLYLQI